MRARVCEAYRRRAVQRVAEVLLRYGQLTLKDIISYCGRPRLAGSHNPLQAKPIVLKPESVRSVWGSLARVWCSLLRGVLCARSGKR